MNAKKWTTEQQQRQALEDARTAEERAAGRDVLLAQVGTLRARREAAQPRVEPPDFEAAVESLKATVAKAVPVSAAEVRAHVLRTSIFPRLKAYGWEDRFFFTVAGDWGCGRQQQKFSRCQELFCGQGAIVALVGPRGVGKTTIGFQLALDRLLGAWDRYHAGATGGLTLPLTGYAKLTDLLARYKALYSDFGTNDPERLVAARDRFCRDDALAVIDEVHECDELKAAPRLLTDLLDRRYAAKRDTLLITNQTAEEFSETIGDSIYSRLTEHGAILKCEWASWRDRA